MSGVSLIFHNGVYAVHPTGQQKIVVFRVSRKNVGKTCSKIVGWNHIAFGKINSTEIQLAVRAV